MEAELKQRGANTVVSLRDESGRSEQFSVDKVLVATGRWHNTNELGFDAAGVEIDKRGCIIMDDVCRASQPHIWTLGEVNGRGAFTHTAYNVFEIVDANLLDGANRKITDRHTVYALFIAPPLGRIGITEAEARVEGLSILVGKRLMSRVGRAVESGETRGR